MNYLRGAVNAISVPYQYYRDLNPSTLTGAIDVIVIRRPKQLSDAHDLCDEAASIAKGETELVCSPFHVRFGKWQVLRPAEKNVNMFVNGNLAPFPMKIGDAGEAFFVFETDEDVPDDLVTSPVLAATNPGEASTHGKPAGRFGAKEHGDTPPASQEPDFLDLNAPGVAEGSPSMEVGSHQPTSEQLIIDQKADEVLPRIAKVEPPRVQYTHDMVFDLEGYHSHTRGHSERTIIDTDGAGPSTPRSNAASHSRSPSAEITPGPSRTPSPEPSPSGSHTSSAPFPIRATSEPPPDLSDLGLHVSQSLPTRALKPSLSNAIPSSSTLKLALPEDTPEFSWEWGNFPQRTPVQKHFEPSELRHAGSANGKERVPHLGDEEYTKQPCWADGMESKSFNGATEDAAFGFGGRLTVDRRDPTKFRVFIEGRTVEFELSLIPQYPDEKGGFLQAGDFENARRFDEGKLDFLKFLEDESILKDDRLAVRWARDTYITQQDHSPLISALALWRDSALNAGSGLLSSRPVSPAASDRSRRANSLDRELPTPDEVASVKVPLSGENGSPVVGQDASAKKPSSSSWVRWWGRSKRDAGAGRPELRPTNSEPGDVPSRKPVGAALRAASPLATDRQSRPSEVVPLRDSKPEEQRPKKRFAKTLRLTSEQLETLNLKPGANSITFSLSSSGVAACTARLFVWDHNDMVVISDIDGTITKSDALGHVFTMIGRDWTHLGVAKLYTDICRNGYKIMYLTSRAIGQADSTRDYLKGIKQNDYQLPEGPVIMSPDRLMASLHREVIMRKPEMFKMACLRDIQRLFGSSARNPFYAGFGNRITDALSYRSVNVPSSRIFTIDSTGEVKMELLELAGYKSSYIHMTDLVDQMFPPIHRKWANEYADFNYWKMPVQEYPLPDLSPPSPALSARSDNSTLSRLRNFSLVGSRSSNNARQFSVSSTPVGTPDSDQAKEQRRKEQHVRQMSSLERLSSTLASLTSSTAASPRPASPYSYDSGSEFAGDEDGAEKGAPGGRRRTRSVSSMPGSLPGSSGSDDEMQFDMEDEDDSREEEYEEQGQEEVGKEAFDELWEATEEMENIPFL